MVRVQALKLIEACLVHIRKGEILKPMYQFEPCCHLLKPRSTDNLFPSQDSKQGVSELFNRGNWFL